MSVPKKHYGNVPKKTFTAYDGGLLIDAASDVCTFAADSGQNIIYVAFISQPEIRCMFV
jgi:hypothetical protein